MDFVTHLMTTSTAELSNLEFALGGVLLAAMGITVAFVLVKLFDRAIEKGVQDDIRDWYENERWREHEGEGF